MEIPPSLSGRFDALLKQAANITSEQLTSLEDVKLIPGRDYPAKVLTRLETKTATTDSKHIAEQTTQWLILISGKKLLVETSAALKSGQVLSAQISAPNKGLTEQTLIIKTDTQNTLPTQAASTTPSTGKQAENIEILLKAMSQTLPRQVSLAAGLNELFNRATQTIPHNSDSAQAIQDLSHAKLSAAILSKLIPGKQEFTMDATLTASGITGINNDTNQKPLPPLTHTLPKSPQAPSQPQGPTEQSKQQVIANILEQINTHTPSKAPLDNEKGSKQAPHLAVIKLLQLSGTLLESKLLLPDLAKVQQLVTELNAVKSSIAIQAKTQNTDNHVAKTKPNTTINTPTKTTTEGQKESTTRSTSTSHFHSASSATASRNNASFQNTQSLKIKTTSDVVQASPTDKPATSLSDLKSTLMSLVVALSGDEESHGRPPRTYLDGLTQTDLLKSPFGFPHVTDNAIMKANALLADQELSTGQLLKLVAGMLNRIQFNQLNSLYQSQNNSSETTTVQSWFFELPILSDQNQANVFNLRIDKEDAAKKEQQRNSAQKALEWRLALSFDLKELGPVYIQVTLNPPTATSTIWAVNKDTLQLIQNERDRFHHRLEALGLELKEIQCHQGQPKQNKAKLDRGFVDTKA